jgi:Predicted nucleotide-binding protein containing TIR-like domain
MGDNRKTLFIGSSTEGLPVARAIKDNLESQFRVEIWNEGVFELMKSTLEGLFVAGQRFEFAILVLTPDDTVCVEGEELKAQRDNVILELGFFLGALGRYRTFIVHEKSETLKLPTEIAGVTCATYHRPPGDDFSEVLVHPCSRIKKAALEAGFFDIPGEEKIQLIVQGALQIVCRALSAPYSPDKAKLRAFVFKKEDSVLVCSHFWAPYPIIEAVDVLKFDITPETEKQVAVVKAAVYKEVCAIPIARLSSELEGMHGKVEDDLCFVLAAPILGPRGQVWGTVDFDTSNQVGVKILNTEMSKNTLFELGRYLYRALTK